MLTDREKKKEYLSACKISSLMKILSFSIFISEKRPAEQVMKIMTAMAARVSFLFLFILLIRRKGERNPAAHLSYLPSTNPEHTFLFFESCARWWRRKEGWLVTHVSSLRFFFFLPSRRDIQSSHHLLSYLLRVKSQKREKRSSVTSDQSSTSLHGR